MSLVYNGHVIAADAPTSAAVTLAASSWAQNATSERYEYSLASSYPAAGYDIEIDLNWDSATDDQIAAWQAASPVGSYSANKIIAMGDVPTEDIPVVVYAVKKA